MDRDSFSRCRTLAKRMSVPQTAAVREPLRSPMKRPTVVPNQLMQIPSMVRIRNIARTALTTAAPRRASLRSGVTVWKLSQIVPVVQQRPAGLAAPLATS